MNRMPGLLMRPTKQVMEENRPLGAPLHSTWIPPSRVCRRALLVDIEDQGSVPTCVVETGLGITEASRWRRTGTPDDISDMLVTRYYSKCKSIDGNNQAGTYPETFLRAAILLGLDPLLVEGCEPVVFDTLNDWEWACHQEVFFHACFSVDEGWFKPRPDGFTPSIRNTGYGHDVIGTGYSYENAEGYEHPKFYSVGNSWGTKMGAAGYYRFTVEQMNEQWMYGMAIRLPDGSLYR